MISQNRSLISKRYYDSLASEFQEMEEYWTNPYDIATWDLENELIQKYLGNKNLLLDLGVGFYPHVESTTNTQLICLDISYASLMMARKNYYLQNEKMEYVCGDALSLPFKQSTFPGIIAGGELINHVPIQPLINEMYRILKPGGILILSVAMKWCLDSLYSVIDSILGNKIGYSMTYQETCDFIKHPRSSTDVTWEVTPNFNLVVTLYTRFNLMKILSGFPFRIVHIRSLDLISGFIPLPIQQNKNSSTLLKKLSKILLSLDKKLFGRIPGIRWFAGNVYMVLEKL